jgi:hypothetical protein
MLAVEELAVLVVLAEIHSQSAALNLVTDN